MTKIHDCFGTFCETAHLTPALGGMLPNRVNCPGMSGVSGLTAAVHSAPASHLCNELEIRRMGGPH